MVAGVLALALLLTGCIRSVAQTEDVAPDLVIHNARVTTLDPERPVAEAVAITGERIVRVGSDATIRALAGDATQLIDANGRRLIPGLNDSHMHVVRGGRFFATELRWEGVPSLEAGLAMIRTQAGRTPDGQWVRVIGGWSPYQFAERRMPTPAELTRAAPDTPVFVLFLYSQGFLNQAGVDALGITAETEPPSGSRYELIPGEGAILHAEPNPTILYQTIGALPGLSPEQLVLSTRHFYRELNRFGLTSAVDAGGGGHLFPVDYEGTRRLAEAGEMPLRVSFYLFPQRPGREYDDFRQWIAENEIGFDGALHLDHGYELEGAGEFLVWKAGDFENFMAPRPELDDRAGWRAELRRVAGLLVREGWPLRIHATYGQSVAQILDVFEAIDRAEKAAGRPGFDGIRWAIDHAETIREDDIERIRAMGGGIAIQSRMAFAGEYFAGRYGEEAAAQAPPIRAMLDAGVPVGVGSDATRVSSYNPWMTLYWLVTGQTAGGTPLAAPANRLGRAEALRLHTVGSAWFSGEEDVKGRLAPGQMADLALLSKDYFAVPEDEIRTIESVLTVTAGRVVYGAGEYAALDPELPPIEPAWSPVRRWPGHHAAAPAP